MKHATADPAIRPGTKPKLKEATLSKRDYHLLLDICNVQSKSRNTILMQAMVTQLARSYGALVWEDNGNIYAEKGIPPDDGPYPCYVAHTDTVHDVIPQAHFRLYYDPSADDALFAYDTEKKRQVGIGGDDKVGIVVALIMLRDLPYAKAAFFRDEEIGCLGAAHATMDFFENCAFVIECDRRGNDDIVQTAGRIPLYGDDFAEAIKPAMDEWGYTNAIGMLTDVKTLKEQGLAVACTNLSCGYYNPHNDTEYIIPGDVARVIQFVKQITRLTKHQAWPHTYTAPAPTIYHGQQGFPDRQPKKNWLAVRPSDSQQAGGFDRRTMEKTLWDEAAGRSCPVCKTAIVFASGFCPECRTYTEIDLWTKHGLDQYGTWGTWEEWTDWDDDPLDAQVIAEREERADNHPYCVQCCRNDTQYDETVTLYWCFLCELYFDPESGQMFIGTDDVGVVIEKEMDDDISRSLGRGDGEAPGITTIGTEVAANTVPDDQ